MPHELTLRLPADPSFVPVGLRLVREAGPRADGPDETAVEALLPSLGDLLTRVVATLAAAGGAGPLDIHVSPLDAALEVHLLLPAGVAVDDLLPDPDPLRAALEAAFSRVQVSGGGEETLQIRLSVAPSA
ncbi:MAG: hypothetical protein ACE5IK_02140 [Acidobacteriota bacterium]